MKTLKLFLRAERGFTLIELMIVIAIIAVLAGFAIPQYGIYVARAQVAEGIALIDGVKPSIVDGIITQGIPAGCIQPKDITTDGKYVASVTVFVSSNNVDNVSCTIGAQFKEVDVSKAIHSAIINFTFTPSNNHWSCVSNLETGIRPQSCTYDANPPRLTKAPDEPNTTKQTPNTNATGAI